jgi:hypothetical protein
MSGTKNSISSLVAQFIRLQKNSLEIINGLNEVATSTNDTVQIEMLDESGLPINASIPAYGYLRSQINRIDSNIQALTGLGDNYATVRNSDGTYSQIYKVQSIREPGTLSNLAVPSTFSVKDNWFFESFLNPLLYISIDVTGQISDDADRVTVKRIIANTQNSDQKTYFDNNLKGRNDISHDAFITELTSNGINYFIDDDIIDLPLRHIRNIGNFGVLAFYDDVVKITDSSGNQLEETRRNYKLNTLSYTDILSDVEGGKTLDVKDNLITSDGTKYKITSVNRDESSVQLERISGYAPVSIGSDSLSISSAEYSPREIRVNVGFDERQAVFFKTIDDRFNIESGTYSPGITFWSNELTIDDGGNIETLEVFYRDQVADMGRIFLGLAKENKITANYGLVPDVPSVDVNNFKVIQINKQISDSVSVKSISDKVATKANLKNEMAALDQSISNKRLELNTSRVVPTASITANPNSFSNGGALNRSLTSTAGSDSIQSSLLSLTREKQQKQIQYNTIVEDLSVSSIATPQIIDPPKYRVRGFWDIPNPKYSETTGEQNVIQFVIRYRYLSEAGTAQPAENIMYVSADGQEKNGSYSNWIINKSEVRSKIYDASKGTYVWETEDTSNSDQVNINQLEIPIKKGEQVEIQIASVSEAGYPENPLQSDYSNSVVISFPDNISVNTLEYSIMANSQDKAVLKIQNDLESAGLPIHLSEQFTNGSKTYYHTTNGISSGFFDGAGNPVSLFDKLIQISNELASLRSIVDNAKGILEVYVTDGENDNIKVSNGEVINLTAGFYNQIFSAPTAADAGRVAVKGYNIQIVNAAASTIELASITPGGLDVLIADSIENVSGYNENLKYSKVPIAITSLSPSDIIGNDGLPSNTRYRQAPPYASGNSYSQFIYPRFKNVGYNDDLYLSGNNPYNSSYLYEGTAIGSLTLPINGESLIPFSPLFLTPPGSGGVNASVWNGTYAGSTGAYTPNNNGQLSEFCIHKDHPAINNGNGTDFIDLVKPDYASNSIVYPAFRHSNYFQNDTSFTGYYKQLEYSNVSTSFVTGGSGDSRSDSMYPNKLGFEANDEYLIGRYSCGAYLYLAPKLASSVQIEGSTALAKKDLVFGTENSINIPLLFQFRCTDKLGNIGGYRSTGSLSNVTYTKKIGIDIKIRNEEVFSFDIQVSGKYKNDKLVSPNFFNSNA